MSLISTASSRTLASGKKSKAQGKTSGYETVRRGDHDRDRGYTHSFNSTEVVHL
jgi:hypothetical protein